MKYVGNTRDWWCSSKTTSFREARGLNERRSYHLSFVTGAKGPDINLSIQYILNCATDVAGSCHGGSATGVYQFIKEVGSVPFDTCQPYLACSAESTEGFCPYADTQCTPQNTCVTCNSFSGFPFNGKCKAVSSKYDVVGAIQRNGFRVLLTVATLFLCSCLSPYIDLRISKLHNCRIRRTSNRCRCH